MLLRLLGIERAVVVGLSMGGYVAFALWRRHREYLMAFLARPTYADEAKRLGIDARLSLAEAELRRVSDPAYLAELVGAIGAHPLS